MKNSNIDFLNNIELFAEKFLFGNDDNNTLKKSLNEKELLLI